MRYQLVVRAYPDATVRKAEKMGCEVVGEVGGDLRWRATVVEVEAEEGVVERWYAEDGRLVSFKEV